jgi:hypothetical protein
METKYWKNFYKKGKQEIEKIIPEAVSERQGYKYVEYSKILRS